MGSLHGVGCLPCCRVVFRKENSACSDRGQFRFRWFTRCLGLRSREEQHKDCKLAAETQPQHHRLLSTFSRGSQIDGTFALTSTLVGSCSSIDSFSSLSQLHSESHFVGSKSL